MVLVARWLFSPLSSAVCAVTCVGKTTFAQSYSIPPLEQTEAAVGEVVGEGEGVEGVDWYFCLHMRLEISRMC